MDILQTVGMEFDHNEACEVFKKHGAKVDGHKVYIPRKMVEDALKLAKPSFEYTSHKCTKTVGKGSKLLFRWPDIFIIMTMVKFVNVRTGIMLISLFYLKQAMLSMCLTVIL